MKSNTLCLIDYDDTLLPSSHLHDLMEHRRKELEKRSRQRKRNHHTSNCDDEGNENYEDSDCSRNDNKRNDLQNKENEGNGLIANEQLTFRSLENAAITLIMEACKRSSRVVVISNAEERWISYTLSHFFPRLGDIFGRNNVLVVSARDTYNQGALFDKPLLWKVHAFRSCAGDFALETTRSGSTFHILSIGDSDHERKAAKIASQEHGASMRTIKLLEMPSVGLLHKQLEYLCAHIDIFVGDHCDGSKAQVELVIAKDGHEITHEIAETSIDQSKGLVISQ